MPDKPTTKSDRKSEPRAHETSSRPGHVPFASLGLSADLLKAVAQLGFEETSPIQSAAIPLIIAGIDVVRLLEGLYGGEPRHAHGHDDLHQLRA